MPLRQWTTINLPHQLFAAVLGRISLLKAPIRWRQVVPVYCRWIAGGLVNVFREVPDSFLQVSEGFINTIGLLNKLKLL